MQANAGMIILAAATLDMKLVKMHASTLAVTVRALTIPGPFSITKDVSQIERPDACGQIDYKRNGTEEYM